MWVFLRLKSITKLSLHIILVLIAEVGQFNSENMKNKERRKSRTGKSTNDRNNYKHFAVCPFIYAKYIGTHFKKQYAENTLWYSVFYLAILKMLILIFF